MLLALVISRRLFTADRLVPLVVTGAVGSSWSRSGRTTRSSRSARRRRLLRPARSAVPRHPVAVARRAAGVLHRVPALPAGPHRCARAMLAGGLLIYAYGGIIDDTTSVGCSRSCCSPRTSASASCSPTRSSAESGRRAPLVVWLGVGRDRARGSRPGPRANRPTRCCFRGRCATGRRCSRSRNRSADSTARSHPARSSPPRRCRCASFAPAYGLGVVAARFHPRRSSTTCWPGSVESSHTLFEPETTDEQRRAIAQKYGVDGVLCATDTCRATIFADDDVVAQGPGWTLFRLPNE